MNRQSLMTTGKLFNEYFSFLSKITARRAFQTVVYLIYDAKMAISVRITPKIEIFRCKYDHQFWPQFRRYLFCIISFENRDSENSFDLWECPRNKSGLAFAIWASWYHCSSQNAEKKALKPLQRWFWQEMAMICDQKSFFDSKIFYGSENDKVFLGHSYKVFELSPSRILEV